MYLKDIIREGKANETNRKYITNRRSGYYQLRNWSLCRRCESSRADSAKADSAKESRSTGADGKTDDLKKTEGGIHAF